MKCKDDQLRCLSFLRGFLVAVLFSGVQSIPLPDAKGSECMSEEIKTEGLVIRYVSLGLPGLVKYIGSQLDTALLNVFQRNGEHCCALVFGLGLAIERALEDSEWTDDPLKCLTPAGYRRRVERHYRDSLSELPMAVVRNQRRASKLMVALGMPGSHRSWQDVAYMRRYLLALRHGLGASRSFAFASDKSRGCGRDWLTSTAVAFEQNLCGWMQPVATEYHNENYIEVLPCLAEVSV
jgi:hypothetical protein